MKVKMLVNTTHKGLHLHAGHEVDVTAEVGQRWLKNKIALIISDDKDTSAVSLKELPAKKLYEMCKEKGLDVEPKQTKEFYLSLLEEV